MFGVTVILTQILGGGALLGITVPPDFGDVRQERWQQQLATHDECRQI